jgi:hypothetical protein
MSKQKQVLRRHGFSSEHRGNTTLPLVRTNVWLTLRMTGKTGLAQIQIWTCARASEICFGLTVHCSEAYKLHNTIDAVDTPSVERQRLSLLNTT